MDIALIQQAAHSSHLEYVPLLEDELIVICWSGHPLAGKTVDLAALSREVMVTREKGSGTRKLFEQYLSAHNIHIQTSWEANCPRTILNAVIHNNALAVISQRLLKH